jgi:hypothetical protein
MVCRAALSTVITSAVTDFTRITQAPFRVLLAGAPHAAPIPTRAVHARSTGDA